MSVALPILKHREQIVFALAKNQVVIVTGETGSGKTTEIPRFLYEAGFGEKGIVGVTEPRRIAALSVAKYVAKKVGSVVGNLVGYKIRHDAEVSKETVIKFMTDGILLREFHNDALLRQYSVVMVDEAHERTANIDFLLGLLKQVLKMRPELKVVIASATIDAEKFSRYFGDAPVIAVGGRLHDVQIIWSDKNPQTLDECLALTTSAVQEAIATSHEGDVLVFLPGISEINATEDALRFIRGAERLVVLPAHGILSPEDQAKVFDSYPGRRKVVLATNIAETSITIEGIVYVIDSGFIKQMSFDLSSQIQSLNIVEHSQAGCEQRAGRAGRTMPGVCRRLFTKENYDRRPQFTEPEIKRMSLAGVVLAMEALEIPDIVNFDFLDPPEMEAFHEAYEMLKVLGAVEKEMPGLTKIGKEMAALPLEPRIARMIIEAKRFGCVADVATIAAFMSASKSIFARPKGKEDEADMAHAHFKDADSDMITFRRIWREYEASEEPTGDWCFRHFLSARTLQEVVNIRNQLFDQLERNGVAMTKSDNDEAVLRSVASGLGYNLIRRTRRNEFSGVARSLYGVFIHPGSAMFFNIDSRWIVANEIVQTTKRYARMCSLVRPEWLPDIAPSLFSFGALVLRSFTEGDETARAVRPILFKRDLGYVDSVGEIEVTISLDEAREVQKQSIANAKKDGWLLLTIEKVPSRFGGFDVWGRAANGTLYRLDTLILGRDIVPGARYFCKLTESMVMRDFAYPQFRVFDFPPREEEKAEGGTRENVFVLPKMSMNFPPKPRPKTDVFEGVTEARIGDGSMGLALAAALQRKKEKK